MYITSAYIYIASASLMSSESLTFLCDDNLTRESEVQICASEYTYERERKREKATKAVIERTCNQCSLHAKYVDATCVNRDGWSARLRGRLKARCFQPRTVRIFNATRERKL